MQDHSPQQWESFPFCFMMDDCIQFYKKITLPSDLQCLAKPRHESISLWHVLDFFQQPVFDAERAKFAMIGFNRLSASAFSAKYDQAHGRRHVCAAVIMNLKKLDGFEYRKEVFVFEDLDFNNRLAEAGEVICKCYRFAYAKKRLDVGVEMSILDEHIANPT